MPPPSATRPVRVWDLPTRLFHWGLTLAIVGSVVTAKIGGDAMVWHFRLGYVVCGLRRLPHRVGPGGWALVALCQLPLRARHGAALPARPGAAGRAPRRRPQPAGRAVGVRAAGHRWRCRWAPASSADDEIANLGPLNRYVDSATGLAATAWHKTWGQWLLLGLVGLHVAAIVFYLVARKTNLVRPMLSGDKPLPADTPAAADSPLTRALALALAALVGAGVAWVVSLGG